MKISFTSHFFVFSLLSLAVGCTSYIRQEVAMPASKAADLPWISVKSSVNAVVVHGIGPMVVELFPQPSLASAVETSIEANLLSVQPKGSIVRTNVLVAELEVRNMFTKGSIVYDMTVECEIENEGKKVVHTYRGRHSTPDVKAGFKGVPYLELFPLYMDIASQQIADQIAADLPK